MARKPLQDATPSLAVIETTIANLTRLWEQAEEDAQAADARAEDLRKKLVGWQQFKASVYGGDGAAGGGKRRQGPVDSDPEER